MVDFCLEADAGWLEGVVFGESDEDFEVAVLIMLLEKNVGRILRVRTA